MEFIKRHKFKLILLLVFLIVLVVAFLMLMNLLYPDSRKDVYGNRLAGIEEVKVSNKVITEIKDKITSNEFVDSVDYSLKGKLINFNIQVKADTDKNLAKQTVNSILETFDADIQSFYDIQVLIIEDKEESTNYPVFAYKHKISKEFIWTNN